MKREHMLAQMALSLDDVRRHVQEALKAVVVGRRRVAIANHLRHILVMLSLLELTFVFQLHLPEDGE